MSDEQQYLYSVQISMIPPNGGAVRIIQIAGGEKLKDLLEQASTVESTFVKLGWHASTGAAVGSTLGPSNGGGQPPANRPANMLNCVKIEVGESFKEPKRPQLKFHCTGESKPIIANAKPGEWSSLLKFVSGITVNGRAFKADDMSKGREFGGTWTLEYEVNGEYKNLKAINNG